MSEAVARLRMFAGPNGSGKTTVKKQLPPKLLGVYVIEKAIRDDGRLPLAPFQIEADTAEVRDYFTTSTFLRAAGLADATAVISCRGGAVDFGGLPPNSYHASVRSDFIRRKLVKSRVSFSFETVMSAPDKVELLREAREAGFRTYLYYVSTEKPSINVSRVKLRVSQGGHDVPEHKIVERYHRSLALLRDAIRHTDRAYFFDTSSHETSGEHSYFAEITAGTKLELETYGMPHWFKTAVWDKF